MTYVPVKVEPDTLSSNTTGIGGPGPFCSPVHLPATCAKAVPAITATSSTETFHSRHITNSPFRLVFSKSRDRLFVCSTSSRPIAGRNCDQDHPDGSCCESRTVSGDNPKKFALNSTRNDYRSGQANSRSQQHQAYCAIQRGCDHVARSSANRNLNCDLSCAVFHN